MKIGSLVECIKQMGRTDMAIPIKGKIYTVGDIGTHVAYGGEIGVLLDEVHNRQHSQYKKEYCFRPTSFRELLPPMQISIESIFEKEKV